MSLIVAVSCAVSAAAFAGLGLWIIRTTGGADHIFSGAMLLFSVLFVLFAVHFATLTFDVTQNGILSRSLLQRTRLVSWRKQFAVSPTLNGKNVVVEQDQIEIRISWMICGYESIREMISQADCLQRKAAQPGATDNPDDAQRLREDH